MSDDLEKQRLKRVVDITERVNVGYDNEMMKLNLMKLEERKEALEGKINSDIDPISKGNANLQLNVVNKSIDDLLQRIDFNLQFDTDVDETSAREFIAKNNLLEDDLLIKQNDILDDLENSLYGKKND